MQFYNQDFIKAYLHKGTGREKGSEKRIINKSFYFSLFILHFFIVTLIIR